MRNSNVSFSPDGWRRKEKLKAQIKKIAISRLEKNPNEEAEVFAAFIEVSMDLLINIVSNRDHQALLLRDLEKSLFLHYAGRRRDK